MLWSSTSTQDFRLVEPCRWSIFSGRKVLLWPISKIRASFSLETILEKLWLLRSRKQLALYLCGCTWPGTVLRTMKGSGFCWTIKYLWRQERILTLCNSCLPTFAASIKTWKLTYLTIALFRCYHLLSKKTLALIKKSKIYWLTQL